MYDKSFAKPVSGELSGVDCAGVSVAATGAFFAGSLLAHAANNAAIRINVVATSLVLEIIRIINTQTDYCGVGLGVPTPSTWGVGLGVTTPSPGGVGLGIAKPSTGGGGFSVGIAGFSSRICMIMQCSSS
jgi:hypothetical protein